MLAFGKHYICILHTKWTDFVNWLVTWLLQTVSITVSVCVSARSRALWFSCYSFFFRRTIVLFTLFDSCSSKEYLIHSFSFNRFEMLLSMDFWCCVFYIRSKLSDSVFFFFKFCLCSFSAMPHYSHIRWVDSFTPNWNYII